MAGPNARQLLERRAAALAQRPTQESVVATIEVVTVSVGGRRYAVEVRHISRILRTSHLCRLPEEGGELVGLVVAGGAAVPVADLGSMLGLSGPARTRPFVVLLDGADLPLGLLVDAVDSFGHVVEMAAIASPDVSDRTAPVERGITSDGAVLLDAEVLLAHPGVAVLALRDPAQQELPLPPPPGESCED